MEILEGFDEHPVTFYWPRRSGKNYLRQQMENRGLRMPNRPPVRVIVLRRRK